MIDYINNTHIFKDDFVETLITIGLICLLSLFISKLLTIYIKKFNSKNTKIIIRLKNICIWSFTLYGIFNQFTAFSDIIKALAAGTGIVTLALGLATQDAVGEFVNGMMIFAFHPFKIDDTIKITEYNIIGKVTDISIRHTVIKTPENTELIIPNSIMNKEILENVSNVNEQKANFLNIKISYDSDLDKAIAIIEEEVTSHPGFIDPRSKEDIKNGKKPVTIRLSDFLDTGMNLNAIIYSKDNLTGIEMMSDLRMSIKKRFDQEGIEIPYPHTIVKIKK